MLHVSYTVFSLLSTTSSRLAADLERALDWDPFLQMDKADLVIYYLLRLLDFFHPSQLAVQIEKPCVTLLHIQGCTEISCKMETNNVSLEVESLGLLLHIGFETASATITGRVTSSYESFLR